MTGPIQALFILIVVIAVPLGLRSMPPLGVDLADRISRIGAIRRALIIALAAFTAGHAVYVVVRSPWESVDGGFVAAVFLVLLMPAAIAIVGLVRASLPLVAAAGAMCLLPALLTGIPVVSFAGFLATGGLDRGPVPSGRELLRGLAVTILGMAAWIVPYLGIDPYHAFDPTRLAVALVLVIFAMAVAIGRPTSREVVGLHP